MLASRIGVAATFAMAVLLRPVTAQQPDSAPPADSTQPALAVGQWVRVVSQPSGNIHEGRLLVVFGDSVAIKRGEDVTFHHLSDATVLQVRRHLRAHPVAGALVGAGIGALLAVVGYESRGMFVCPSYGCTPASSPLGEGGLAAVGAVVGGFVGFLAGRHIYTSRWDTIGLDQVRRVRVGIVPQGGGRLGLGASLGF